MKSTIYTRLTVIAIAGVLAACSAATPDDKKAQLEQLKKQEKDISKQIQQLESEIAQENPDSTTVVKSKEVTVAELALRKFDHYVKTQGSVDAEDNILVSAKSPGVVTAVYIKEGQQVSKGQVLAQIDNSVIIRSIEAQKSQLELAKTVFERQKNLWDQKIGTEVQYLQAKTNKESLEKQLESLNEQNDMTRIKAPISGTVDDVAIKIGENIAPGMPAVRVVNTSDLKLIANVSEAYVTAIKKGNSAVISIPELKKEITAKVTFVGKTIDPLSRTFPVEIKLPADGDLRPNMTGILKVIFHTEPSTIVVPVNVVQELNKEKIVFVAETNGKQTVARKRVVTVEGVYDNLAQVNGLKAGEKIITFGYQGLNDGQVIKI
ncbi:efflux RND transporter periplasmic adaptor subunit [Ohtaekwangia kribbensis]|uniref:Efflux RND transporter periplasmic adaptor subunit n=1 Tax=Ohtaekwangia kribbensis TaxID=688913 RepID=A0ABW3JXW1_9BACT